MALKMAGGVFSFSGDWLFHEGGVGYFGDGGEKGGVKLAFPVDEGELANNFIKRDALFGKGDCRFLEKFTDVTDGRGVLEIIHN